VAGAGDEGQLLCGAVASWVGLTFFLFYRSLTVTSRCGCFGSVRVCVVSMRLWNVWLQIALEWLHDCCPVVLPCA
jgi:hypothetical protein